MRVSNRSTRSSSRTEPVFKSLESVIGLVFEPIYPLQHYLKNRQLHSAQGEAHAQDGYHLRGH